MYEEPYKRGLWDWPDIYERAKQVSSQPAGTLRGLPASSGVVEGVARVVESPAEFDQVQKGDVLVCKMTNPAWVVLFTKISGLVTDSGANPRSFPASAAVQLEETYPYLLRDALPGSTFYQLSFGNIATEDLVSQATAYLTHWRPHFIVVQSGLTDCRPEAFSEVQKAVINRLPARFFAGLRKIRCRESPSECSTSSPGRAPDPIARITIGFVPVSEGVNPACAFPITTPDDCARAVTEPSIAPSEEPSTHASSAITRNDARRFTRPRPPRARRFRSVSSTPTRSRRRRLHRCAALRTTRPSTRRRASRR